jgi:hypothetical protein
MKLLPRAHATFAPIEHDSDSFDSYVVPHRMLASIAAEVRWHMITGGEDSTTFSAVSGIGKSYLMHVQLWHLLKHKESNFQCRQTYREVPT